MFVYVAIIISLIGLFIATYTDLKSRIVTNKLNFGLLAAGLIIFAAQSIYELSPWPIALSVFGACFGFGFAWVLWKIGVFAGGDVKLFMGLGALNAYTPALFTIGLLKASFLPLFPISLFMYSLIAFLPYGMGMTVYKLYKNKPFQKKLFGEMKVRVKQWTHAALFTASAYILLSVATTSQLLTISWAPLIAIPAVIIWGFTGRYKKFITIIAVILAAISNWETLAISFIGLELFVLIMYGSAKIMFSMRPLLSHEVLVSKLEEGMIPGKTLIWKGKKVEEAASLSVASIIKYARLHKINELLAPQKVIISATKARGLTNEEIAKLRGMVKKGLIGKSIPVKDSMPFVPTMLIGYVLCIILGDIFWTIILGGII